MALGPEEEPASVDSEPSVPELVDPEAGDSEVGESGTVAPDVVEETPGDDSRPAPGDDSAPIGREAPVGGTPPTSDQTA